MDEKAHSGTERRKEERRQHKEDPIRVIASKDDRRVDARRKSDRRKSAKK